MALISGDYVRPHLMPNPQNHRSLRLDSHLGLEHEVGTDKEHH